MSSTDQQLLDSWQTKRDAEAFNALLQRYARMVYATCLRILKNPQDAEEVAQDCFVILANAQANIAGYLGPWLHRVATTRSLDRRKADVRRRSKSHNTSPATTIDQSIMLDELAQHVDAAITALPEEQREVIVAHFLEGRTQTDIARELKISQQAVSHRIKVGIAAIRESLQDRGIVVTAAVLATSLVSTTQALPATLIHTLAKLALSGAQNIVPASSVASTTALVGGVIVKKTIIVAAGAIIAIGAALYYTATTSNVPKGPIKPISTLKPKAPTLGNNLGETQVTPAAPVASASTSEAAIPRLRLGEIEKPDDYASVSGRVTDVEGNPIAEANVSIVAVGRDIADTQKGGAELIANMLRERDHLQVVQTAADGSYRIDKIRFRGVALATVNVEGFVVSNRAAGELQIEARGNYENIDFVLEPGRSLPGVVLGPNGEALAGATVFCADSGSVMTTAQDGAFNVSIPAKRSRLTFYLQHEVHGQEVFADVLVSDDAIIELRMSAVARLNGTITLADGKPAVGFDVHVTGRSEADGGIEKDIPILNATTDAEGHYEFSKVSGAYYPVIQVFATESNPASPQIDLEPFIAGATRTWDYIVQDEMTIHGVVRGKNRRDPMPDKLVVWALDERIMGESKTDENGKYQLSLTAAQGRYVIAPLIVGMPFDKRLSALAYESAATVPFEPGTEREVNLDVPDSATAFATFVDESGKPVVDGIEVRATMMDRSRASHKSSGNLYPDSDGSFSWNGFQAGVECQFSAWPDGSDFAFTRSEEFQVDPNAAPLKLVVQLHRTAKLTGRLLGPDGSVLRSQSFWCNLRLADGTDYGPITGDTSWNGYFNLEPNEYSNPSTIPAAEFTITIFWADENRNVSKWVSNSLEAAPGETIDIGEVQIETPVSASS